MCDKFRPASDSDLDEIWLLFRKATENLQRSHIDQWDDTYPDRQILADDIKKRQMYVLILDGRIVSAIVLNEEQYEGYDGADWSDREGRPAVIHRLCVHPNIQSKGIGRKMVREAENFLAEAGYTSIRLDAFGENKKALSLYENMGYSQRGTTTFRKGVFGLYEKRL